MRGVINVDDWQLLMQMMAKTAPTAIKLALILANILI